MCARDHLGAGWMIHHYKTSHYSRVELGSITQVPRTDCPALACFSLTLL